MRKCVREWGHTYRLLHLTAVLCSGRCVTADLCVDEASVPLPETGCKCALCTCLRCPVCFLAARGTVSCCAAAVHSSRSECGHGYHTPPSCFPRHDVSAGLYQSAHLWRSTSLWQNAATVFVTPCIAGKCSAGLNKAEKFGCESTSSLLY